MSVQPSHPPATGTTVPTWREILGAAVVSALAYALYSRAAWPWIALGWVGLVPWLRLLDRVVTMRGALAAGTAMAVAFELAVFGWFAPAIADYTGAPTLVLLAILTLLSPLLQPELVTVALARFSVQRAGLGTAAVALASASTFVATEAIVPKLFGDTLGYPLHGAVWLRQGADIAGVPGLTFVIVLVNEAVWVALRAASRDGMRSLRSRAVLAPAGTALALVVLLASYGAWRCRQVAPSAGESPVTVGVVQADLDHYDRMAAEIGRFETVRAILDTHTELSAPALARADLDLLIWPETVYPTTFGHPKSEAGADFDREIVAFVERARVPLVFGSYDTDGAVEYNAALFLAPDAGGPRPFAVYRKARLFPLTERVPAFLDFPLLRRALPWLGTWSAGAGGAVVPVTLPRGRAIRVAPLICYDVLDPGLARAATRAGADVIVTLSNDSWFQVGQGPELHLLGAAFRSIETRRPQVRATNTGISAVIDATGTLVARAGTDERTTLIAGVTPERRVTTLVVRFGEWVNPLAMAVTGALLLVARRRGRPRPV